MVKNVLEKGIQTWYSTADHRDGAFIGRDLVIYNDRAVEGSIGIYDAHYDTNIYETSVVNFETAIYTWGGRFYECTAWISGAWTNSTTEPFRNVTFAKIAGGGQSLFDNCTVDTMRYGYVLSAGAGCTINNTLWFTNTTFYPAEVQAKYPRTFFYAEDPASAQFYVNGVQMYADSHLSFSNAPLPKSIFLNVRYPEGATGIANLRNDTDILRSYAAAATTKLDASSNFDAVTADGCYDCALLTGEGGTNAPPAREMGVLRVETAGNKIVQTFIGTKTVTHRVFDGVVWGAWITE